MSEPTPLSLSHHFTNLVGRKVTFAPTTIAPETKIKQMYGIYNVLPNETAIVVKADLPLLGSLAGVMVGLPDSAVKECLGKSPLEELLRDAIHEVLNVASTVVTNEGRAVFARMVTDTGLIDGAAGQLFKKPDRRTYFNVLVDGYQGGKFTIFAQFQPVKTVNV
jgi:hypothetical protein